MKRFAALAAGLSVAAFVLALALFELPVGLSLGIAGAVFAACVAMLLILTALERLMSTTPARRPIRRSCTVCKEPRIQSGRIWLCPTCDGLPADMSFGG